MSLIDVDTIAFTVLGYPMSYLEFTGTVLYLWSVWLMTRRNVLTWPVGIVSVLLYLALFYQIHLYSDALEQLYYLGTSVYGWWYWTASPRTDSRNGDVSFSRPGAMAFPVVLTLAFALGLGLFMSRAHVLLPAFFPEDASFPYLDALTTVMSFTAMWLMARKKTESWIYWIIVDVIGIGLYCAKDVRFVALLYVALLFLAAKGLISWIKVGRPVSTKEEQPG